MLRHSITRSCVYLNARPTPSCSFSLLTAYPSRAILRALTTKKEDVFSPDPIVTSTGLSPASWKKPSVYSSNFFDLFKHIALDKATIVGSDTQGGSPIHESSQPQQNTLYHKNFIEYLTVAYNNHFSVEISPDVIFYTILCEIAESIKQKPTNYKHLFTDSDTPVVINVIEPDITKLNVDKLVEQIIQKSPITQLLSRKFSSTTPQAQIAHAAALCDSVSPYFVYTNTSCGIPRVKLLGTKEDWVALEDSLNAWCESIFKDRTDELHKYSIQCKGWINKMHASRDPEFWNTMFAIDECTSGHTHKVVGWITQLYRSGDIYWNGKKEATFGGLDFYNYNSHVSSVKFSNTDTGRKFEMLAGLLYSTFKGGLAGESKNEIEAAHAEQLYPFLRPHFSHITRETSLPISVETYDRYIQSLQEEDQTYLKLMRPLMKEPVIFNGLTKDAQKFELQNILLSKLIKSADQGQIVNSFDILYDSWCMII